MKDAATMKDKKSKEEVEMNKIRRWILKSVSKATPETAVTLYSIKKFLDSKQNGLSINPETKLVMKRLTESGHLVKIDGKYFDGKNSPKDKQPPAQKRKSGSELKNLAESDDKNSPKDKQPPAQKRKSGSELKELAKSDGKNSPKDKQPPAQKRKSGGELKNLAKGSVTTSAEKSSTQEAVQKESETVGLDMETQ
ncbi:hypothetical protein AVEN_178555-1 [Araneus ventricosus]|uniref:H15 domain-containing protein n=1 Tax=Araneus ventricosus TaxID=182803 RepID=A0A4Y2HHG6_ARAVE|nr:hypothetical protein AVEN_178555-1 [Araneus ventricosus]